MEETKMSEVVSEIKQASEDELKVVIEEHFERVRVQGMKIGAQSISVVIFDAINKNLKNGFNSSLRDYQRAFKKVYEILSVQLTEQNDLNISSDTAVAEETV